MKTALYVLNIYQCGHMQLLTFFFSNKLSSDSFNCMKATIGSLLEFKSLCITLNLVWEGDTWLRKGTEVFLALDPSRHPARIQKPDI